MLGWAESGRRRGQGRSIKAAGVSGVAGELAVELVRREKLEWNPADTGCVVLYENAAAVS